VRRWWLASVVLFCVSVALMAASIASDDGQVGLILIFPFIVAWGPLAVAGAVLLLLAVLCAFVGIWSAGEAAPREVGGSGEGAADATGKRESRFGGVVMIGPLPIAFGSDKETAKGMMIVGIALFVILLLVFLVIVHPFI